MAARTLTAEQIKEMGVWQAVLDDRTRSDEERMKARTAIERLNVEGPWAKIEELEQRVAVLEVLIMEPEATPKFAKGNLPPGVKKVPSPKKAPLPKKAPKFTDGDKPNDSQKNPTPPDELDF